MVLGREPPGWEQGESLEGPSSLTRREGPPRGAVTPHEKGRRGTEAGDRRTVGLQGQSLRSTRLSLPHCLGGPHSLAGTDLALDRKRPSAVAGAALSSLHPAPAKAQNADCQCRPRMVLPAGLTVSGPTAHSVKTQLFNPEI